MKKADLRCKFATPAARLLIAASLVLLGAQLPSYADESDEISDVADCRKIAAKMERLLCYDTIVDGQVYGRKQLEKVQKENFGKNEKESVPTIDQVSVTIVNVQKSSSGTHYFHTADGSVWKQSGKGSWNLPVPFQARVKSGALGSYFLVAESGKSTRVKRVR